jgi:hypothetical protein
VHIGRFDGPIEGHDALPERIAVDARLSARAER